MGLLETHYPTNIDGFEFGDLSSPRNDEIAAGGGAIVNAGMRTGVYCFQAAPFGAPSYCPIPFAFTSSGAVQNSRDFKYAYARFYVSMVFNGLAAGQKAKVASFFDGAPGSLTERAYLSIGSPSDGAGPVLYFTDQVGTTTAGTIQIAAGAGFKRIEMFLDSPNGRASLRVDGTTDFFQTGLTILSHDSMCVGAYTTPVSGYVANFDDVKIEASDALTTIDWPGPGSILRLLQNGDAENESSSWQDQGLGTTNIYLSVDEVPPDGDTTYIRTGTKDKRYMSDFQTAAAAGISGTVSAVKVQSRVRNEGGSCQFSQNIRVGTGTIYELPTPQNFTGSYTSRMSQTYRKTPDDLDWELTDIDSFRAGGILRFNVGTIYARLTAQLVQVEFDSGVTSFFLPRITVEPNLGGRRLLINQRPM